MIRAPTVRSWMRSRPATAFVVLNVGSSAVAVALCKLLSLDAAVAATVTLPIVFSPLVTSIWITHVAEGEEGVRALVSKFFRWRVSWSWALVAAGVFPLLASFSLAIRWLTLGIAPQAHNDVGLATAVPLAFFLFFFPGITEELGWRGFLQPRLQRRSSAFVASIGVGLTWGLWHGRSLVTDPDRYTPESYGLFLLFAVGASVLIGWVWNHTGGNVPLAMLGHFGANVTFLFFPMGSPDAGDHRLWMIYAGVLWAAAMILVLARGLAPDDRRRRGNSASSV